MKKLKKYIYPFIFLAAYIVFIKVLTTILNTVLDKGSYGGIGIFILVMIVLVVVITPIYCVFYSNVIKDEKHNFLFAVYNSLVLSIILNPFELDSDRLIIMFIYILWTGLWSCARFKKDMQGNDDDDY